MRLLVVSPLVCATGVSLIAIGYLIGATPHRRDGLKARRMAMLWAFHARSLCRHVYREFMRSAGLNLTSIILATAYHRRSYAERYSRSIGDCLTPQLLELTVFGVMLLAPSVRVPTSHRWGG